MLKRLLITGAAGALGRAMTPRLRDMAQTLRLADIAPVTDSLPDDEIVQCDLGDAAAVEAMVAGCDAILHLGGVSVERPFEPILQGNIIGIYNLYEAARKNGLPRIIFASSNHTVGFHLQSERLDANATFRPDSLYGVSKIFGESMASLYHDKFGQETALVRIGSCFPEPQNHRMLGSWLSYDDFESMIRAVFAAPKLGCPVIWGASNNDAGWWDNSHIAELWQARDNAEVFHAQIDATVPRPPADDPTLVYQGGIFTTYPIYHKSDA